MNGLNPAHLASLCRLSARAAAKVKAHLPYFGVHAAFGLTIKEFAIAKAEFDFALLPRSIRMTTLALTPHYRWWFHEYTFDTSSSRLLWIESEKIAGSWSSSICATRGLIDDTKKHISKSYIRNAEEIKNTEKLWWTERTAQSGWSTNLYCNQSRHFVSKVRASYYSLPITSLTSTSKQPRPRPWSWTHNPLKHHY